MSKILSTGAPHFASLMKQYRQASYTLPKVVNEFVDNAIKKATKINLLTQVDDENRLQELCVSDNIESGFDNMDATGVNNPFNMGHIKIAHEDDCETSEFGVGMKAGALSAANQLNVYSRITVTDGKYKYIEVECNFIRMSKETDVNASYNPRIREILYEEYKEYHPFESGSTIKLSKIRDGIYQRTTQTSITRDLCKELSETYTRFISSGSIINVNGVLVEPIYDYFIDSNCVPFIVQRDLFVLDNGGPQFYFARQTLNANSEKWFKYDYPQCTDKKTKSSKPTNANNEPKKKWNSTTPDEIEMLRKSGYTSTYHKVDSDGVCLRLRSVFTFYSTRLHTAEGKRVDNVPMPDDVTYIYKDGRIYGKKSLFKHIDGCHNFTLNDIDFVSKKLGKDIGITFNKEISMNGKNDLIMAIKSAFEDTRRNISANRTSASYFNSFQKAIKIGIMRVDTCPKEMLPLKKEESPINSNIIANPNVAETVYSENEPKTHPVNLNVGSHSNAKIMNKWFMGINEQAAESSITLSQDILLSGNHSPTKHPRVGANLAPTELSLRNLENISRDSAFAELTVEDKSSTTCAVNTPIVTLSLSEISHSRDDENFHQCQTMNKKTCEIPSVCNVQFSSNNQQNELQIDDIILSTEDVKTTKNVVTEISTKNNADSTTSHDVFLEVPKFVVAVNSFSDETTLDNFSGKSFNFGAKNEGMICPLSLDGKLSTACADNTQTTTLLRSSGVIAISEPLRCEEFKTISATKLRRTIDIIVKLQQMIANEMELSEEMLNLIERSLA